MYGRRKFVASYVDWDVSVFIEVRSRSDFLTENVLLEIGWFCGNVDGLLDGGVWSVLGLGIVGLRRGILVIFFRSFVERIIVCFFNVSR